MVRSSRSRDPGGLPSKYFEELWEWIENGGAGHVAAYLRAYDLSRFNPKASPSQTEAFFEICGANRSTESGELADALEELGRLGRERGEDELLVFTKAMLMRVAQGALWTWLNSRVAAGNCQRNWRSSVSRRLETPLQKIAFGKSISGRRLSTERIWSRQANRGGR